MSLSATIQPKDIVFIQRDSLNNIYGEVHVSGSNLIIYIDSNGYLNADTSASFYQNFPPYNTVSGWTGTFATGDARSASVQFGIITNVA